MYKMCVKSPFLKVEVSIWHYSSSSDRGKYDTIKLVVYFNVGQGEEAIFPQSPRVYSPYLTHILQTKQGSVWCCTMFISLKHRSLCANGIFLHGKDETCSCTTLIEAESPFGHVFNIFSPWIWFSNSMLMSDFWIGKTKHVLTSHSSKLQPYSSIVSNITAMNFWCCAKCQQDAWHSVASLLKLHDIWENGRF